MDALNISGLTKKYPTFTLSDITFSVAQGHIMGLIGKNGAGKTTLLKSMLNLVNPTSGSVTMFGQNFYDNEATCKQSLGVVFGEVDYYELKKLKDIANVTKRFYTAWNETDYQKYLKEFSLDENKRVKELSSGMRVKFSLALALSHGAKLLILDEPTSGLDPVARDDLLELFLALVKDGTRSIIFSTHITSDLDKSADDITYIKEGKVLKTADKKTFMASFDYLKEPADTAPLTLEEIMIRTERTTYNV